MKGANIRNIGKNVFIHPTAEIDVEYLEIGDFSKINKGVQIKGRQVIIGREAWLDEGSRIGGGRAEVGTIKVGDFFHLGRNAEINTASDVSIGDEVGIGMDSKIFTHGAYLSQYNGFPYQVGPISIGNNVWIPNAMILPNVNIGDNVVIGAMSLVNKNIPEGCLAGGIPASIIRCNCFPKKMTEFDRGKILTDIRMEAAVHYKVTGILVDDGVLVVGGTRFSPSIREIEGSVNEETEIVKNLFRRHGIRFRYYNENGKYIEWEEHSTLQSG